MLNRLMMFLLLSGSAMASPSVQVQALANKGLWEAAGDLAAKEGDYVTAGMFMHRAQECPTAKQPKGQSWDAQLAEKGVQYARTALNDKLQGLDAVDTYISLANNLALYGLVQTQTIKGLRGLNSAAETVKESKFMYDRAIALNGNDVLAVAAAVAFHGRSYNRGGIMYGVTKDSASKLLSKGITLFNAAPDSTREQQLRKAFAAHYMAVGMEGLNDKRLTSVFKAAIQLGERAGGAEGRCVANLARIHLGQPIGDY